MIRPPMQMTCDNRRVSLRPAIAAPARGVRAVSPRAPLAPIRNQKEVSYVVATRIVRGRSVGTPKHSKAGAAPHNNAGYNAISSEFRAGPVVGQMRDCGYLGGTAITLQRVEAPDSLLSKAHTRPGGSRVAVLPAIPCGVQL